ncbi:MAG: SH3 domain-containing protein [Leptospira sp.]|nr:SH3 domain-containing protein [Leptospira sp.]
MKVLDVKVPNKPQAGRGYPQYLYKVEWNNAVLYVPYKEQKFMDFEAISLSDKPSKVKVSVGSLRMREYPTKDSEVTATLSRNTELELLGLGASGQREGNRYDSWAYVKTSDGKLGYVFGGFLEGEGLTNRLGDVEVGFVELEKDSETFPNLDAVKLTESQIQKWNAKAKEKCKNCIYAPYLGKTKIQDRTFYYVQRNYEPYDDTYGDESTEDNSIHIEGWVESSFVKTSGVDYFKYGKKQIKDKGLIQIVDYLDKKMKSSIYNNDLVLDTIHLREEKINNPSGDGTFYIVSYKYLDENLNPENGATSVFSVNKSQASYLFDVDYHTNRIDINGDGIEEWISRSENRGASDSVYIYYINKGKLGLLISLNGDSCVLHVPKEVIGKDLTINDNKVGCDMSYGNGEIKVEIDKDIYTFQFDGERLVRK